MDFLQIIAAAITLGSALGATVAGFYAYRSKLNLQLLREANADYQKRVDQLEDERDQLNTQLKQMAADIKRLQETNQIPLDNFAKMIRNNHNTVMNGIDRMAVTVDNLIEHLAPLEIKK